MIRYIYSFHMQFFILLSGLTMEHLENFGEYLTMLKKRSLQLLVPYFSWGLIDSLIINNHQANVADKLWELTGHQYCFVELANLQAEHKKGDTRNYDECPYLLRAWESEANWQKAMKLARIAECCVFSGVQALPFQKERMKLSLLSFDMSERWLKQGLKNVLSPAISKMFLAYWLGGWKNKPLYKLCCSAFCKGDHEKLGMFHNKCYKWGYFTSVGTLNENENENLWLTKTKTGKG